jgi:hypothetical protein
MKRSPHYYMVRERMDGWNIISHGTNKSEVDKDTRQKLQEEHKGLWLSQYANCKLITRTQAIRDFGFNELVLDEMTPF